MLGSKKKKGHREKGRKEGNREYKVGGSVEREVAILNHLGGLRSHWGEAEAVSHGFCWPPG